jgi:glycine/D-amino acid oxidase-like deaminating enzyme
MTFARSARATSVAALSDAAPIPYWLDSAARPEPTECLDAAVDTDLAVVGAGFTGLWTALLAKEAEPDRDVVLLEGGRTAHAASGRNGGFCAASLTHGLANGMARFPDEMPTLLEMGRDNLDGIADTIARYRIDAGFERTGDLSVATEAYQVDDLKESQQAAATLGEHVQWLDADELGKHVQSPLYLGGLYDPAGVALVDPARLAWGLRRACLELGVRLYEQTPVLGMDETPGGPIRLQTPLGTVDARRVALATSAFPPLLGRIRQYVVPVYDYALMTEPLSAQQRAEIGWEGRQGIGDCGNQFHYLRPTQDDRILFGGYDAIYHWKNGFSRRHEARTETFELLAEHFFQTFPQLEGLRFTHQWGGAIDTCSRFCAFWGTARRGRVAYSTGYTGLGVGASRFGAAVMLDLLDERDTDRTRLQMVRSKPLPFPPEPLRSAGINLTRWSLDRADRREGRRNLWLRGLDRVGLGFDS